ncbi:hypothetical protein GCM10018955_14390 [Planomonospora venezuelensis]
MRSGDQKEVAWEADSEADEATTSPGPAAALAPVLVAPIAPAIMRRPVRGIVRRRAREFNGAPLVLGGGRDFPSPGKRSERY